MHRVLSSYMHSHQTLIPCKPKKVPDYKLLIHGIRQVDDIYIAYERLLAWLRVKRQYQHSIASDELMTKCSPGNSSFFAVEPNILHEKLLSASGTKEVEDLLPQFWIHL